MSLKFHCTKILLMILNVVRSKLIRLDYSENTPVHGNFSWRHFDVTSSLCLARLQGKKDNRPFSYGFYVLLMHTLNCVVTYKVPCTTGLAVCIYKYFSIMSGMFWRKLCMVYEELGFNVFLRITRDSGCQHDMHQYLPPVILMWFHSSIYNNFHCIYNVSIP